MATIDEIAERAARDLRADVRGVVDTDAGLTAIVGGAGSGASDPARRAWWIAGWSVAAAAAVLVTFLVVRDDSTGTVVPATTPPTQPLPSTASTSSVDQPSTSIASSSTVPLNVRCDPPVLLGAVQALFPENELWNPTNVIVDACRNGFAQVVAIADASTCPTVGVPCRENERVWLQVVDGVWTYLDSGTGIGCSPGEQSPNIEPACAALERFLTVDPQLSFEPIDLPEPACSDAGECTTVLATLSGRLATFRTGEHVLAFVDDGTTFTLEVGPEWMAHPLAFGPDDVLYLSLSSRTSEDSGGTIAVATSGPRAGDTVATSDVGLDTSGDSTAVSTAAGLVQVGCCGRGDRQPAPTDPLLIGWVSADGSALAPLETEAWIEYAADGTATVVRSDAGVERRWALEGNVGGRDMPIVVPTDDSGVLLWQYDGIGAPDVPPVLYEGRPDGSVDRYDLSGFNYPSVLSPARFVILLGGDGYVRTELP